MIVSTVTSRIKKKAPTLIGKKKEKLKNTLLREFDHSLDNVDDYVGKIPHPNSKGKLSNYLVNNDYKPRNTGPHNKPKKKKIDGKKEPEPPKPAGNTGTQPPLPKQQEVNKPFEFKEPFYQPPKIEDHNIKTWMEKNVAKDGSWINKKPDKIKPDVAKKASSVDDLKDINPPFEFKEPFYQPPKIEDHNIKTWMKKNVAKDGSWIKKKVGNVGT